ncbi:MAG: hypothetical protein AAFV33_24850 [Chloroflexota bacterium]
MNFLKNMFSGSNDTEEDRDSGIYVYVRPRGCEEVIRVRLNPSNDLSRAEGGGYFVRKIARGNHRCFDPVEMTLYFNGDRKLTENEVSGGELVGKDEFDEWEAKLAAKKAAIAAQNAAVDAQREDA